MKNVNYRGFISFSHKDSDLSLNLHKRLEEFRVPKALRGSNLGSSKLGLFFRDREELAANMQLSEQIRDALSRSESLIVVCSLNSVKSEWVKKEIESYISLRPNGQIFAVIASGEPPDCFPLPLRNFEFVASDFRPQADGVENGTLKLISGIIGIRFSDLKDRVSEDNRKRHRRVISLAICFALLTLLSIGGLVATYLYANRANKLASAAIETYGEVGDKGFELGLNSGASLSAVEEFLNFSSDKLKELEQHGLQKEELMSRSLWIKLRFSHLFLQRKEFERALPVAEDVVAATKGRNDYSSMLTYTSAIASKSQALSGLGRKEEALAAAKVYLEEATRFNDTFPKRYETRLVLSEAHRLLGQVLSESFEESSELAIDHFSNSIQILNDLIKEFPNSATFAMQLADNYKSMGDLAQKMNDPTRLADWYNEAVNWNYRFFQYNKPRLEFLQEILEIALKASESYINLNNYKQSEKTMITAINALKIGDEQYPNNSDIHHNLERAKTILSEIESRQNPFDSNYTSDIATIGTILSRAQQNMDAGDEKAEEGEPQMALIEFQNAITLLLPIAEKDTGGKEAMEMYGKATLFGGANAVDAGNFETASKLLYESVNIWNKLINDFPEISEYTQYKNTAEKVLSEIRE